MVADCLLLIEASGDHVQSGEEAGKCAEKGNPEPVNPYKHGMSLTIKAVGGLYNGRQAKS